MLINLFHYDLLMEPTLKRLPNFRRNSATSAIFTILFCLLIAGCSTLPDNLEKNKSWTYPPNDEIEEDSPYSIELSKHPRKSGVLLLNSGLDAFASRLAMVTNARSTIDSQYYLYHNDQTGKVFTQKLLEAANRGVRVRLLVDDMDQSGRDFGAVVLDSHPNIQVRIFNPFSRKTPRLMQFLTRFGDVTRRMHNKTLTVDQRISVLGGRNIGDEYFDASEGTNFTDLDALVIGPVVKQIAISFDEYWNDKLSYPIDILSSHKVSEGKSKQMLTDFETIAKNGIDARYVEAVRNSEFAVQLNSQSLPFDYADVQAIFDRPEKFESDDLKYYLASDLAGPFENVRSRLIIISPYFVPGKEGTLFLSDLARNGIQVKVLTNSLASTDVAVVHAGYIKYRKDLLKAGVEIYEVQSNSQKPHMGNWKGSSSASLHSKAFIFDNKEVFVGSLNLDPRSVYENSEIGLLIKSSEVAGKLTRWYEDYSTNNAYKVFLQDSWSGMKLTRWHVPGALDAPPLKNEPDSGILLRAGINLIRFLPIESQL